MATTAQMQQYASQVAGNNGVPSDLFLNLIGTESSWNPNAVSSAGAQGLGQLMPGTAANLGVTNSFDWQQSLNGSAQYLSQLYSKFGNWTDAVAAYNAGPGRIQSVLNGNSTLPQETQNYINKILGNGSTVSGSGSTSGQDTGGSVNVSDNVSWTDAIANFFSFNTGTRIIAVGIGIIFLIAAVFVLVSGNKQVQLVASKAVEAAAV